MNLVARLEANDESVDDSIVDPAGDQAPHASTNSDTAIQRLNDASYPWILEPDDATQDAQAQDNEVWNEQQRSSSGKKERSSWCRPCHYFGYIAGTSTGGEVQHLSIHSSQLTEDS